MRLNDQDAIKALKRVRVYELEGMISDYPESERDGRSDWEMIANEAGWLLDSYNSQDTVRHDDIEEARDILSKTRYGKVTYLTFSGKPYSDYDVQNAKDRVNEYNRLVRFVGMLKRKGLYCPYC